MADFRRSIFVLAALALLLGTVGIASAQPAAQFTCTANAATPPLVRGEGITELTGDLLLTCTGGTATGAGVTVPTANIQIFLNTAITSRLISGPNDEALLMVDDPQPVAGPTPIGQNPCPIGTVCPMWGRGDTGGTSSYDGQVATVGSDTRTNRNVFFGQQVPGNSGSIVWLGIPVDPPGTVTPTRVFRITNVRANASALIVAGPNQPPTAITSTISISPPTALPLNNFSAQLTVGFAAKGLLASNSSVVTFKQCTDVNVSDGTLTLGSGAPNGEGNAGNVTLSEGFAQAFKVRSLSTWDGTIGTAGSDPTTRPHDIPGAVFSTATETGFYSPTYVSTIAGLADFGTRLKIAFSNVPTGAHVYVPVALRPGTGTGLTSNLGTSSFTDPLLAGGSLWLDLVTSESGAYTAASAGSFGTGLSEVSITAGSGQAVYEVVREDPSAAESALVDVTVAYIANPGAGSPAIGPVATASASFAPISNDFVAEVNTVPVPRFVNNSTAGNLFSVIACATHLLYPFVTNQAGYDTGIAIANTSQDPYGTSTQTGTCVVTPFGVPTSSAFTTPADVAPGTVWANLVSIMFPGFQGYLIADCAFQYAHGFAFISSAGGVAAEGYLALVIPDPPRSANPFPSAGVGSGEQLGY